MTLVAPEAAHAEAFPSGCRSQTLCGRVDAPLQLDTDMASQGERVRFWES